jgi:hypothetical protein
MSLGAKVYKKILLHRIRGPIDNMLRVNQADFRRNRSCTEQKKCSPGWGQGVRRLRRQNRCFTVWYTSAFSFHHRHRLCSQKKTEKEHQVNGGVGLMTNERQSFRHPATSIRNLRTFLKKLSINLKFG